MRLPTPRHVWLATLTLGLGTLVLGFGYLTTKVYRVPELEEQSVVAVIERPLGGLMLVVGAWVFVAGLTGCGRAIAHAVAAILHGAYFVALAATYVLAYPLQPEQGVALGLFGLVAHGGASIDYWQRGWR